MAAGDLQVLKKLDLAKTQLYHFKAIIIAGMGFFTEAYDLFCISLVTKLLGRIYYFDPTSDTLGTLPPNVSAAVNGAAFCGTLAGQLFFGWRDDKMGRKRVYGMTLMLMVICSLASGLSFGHTPNGVMASLCFFCFGLGFGIGGDCPLSATIMSEYANKKLAAPSSPPCSRCRGSVTSPVASFLSSSPPCSRASTTRRTTTTTVPGPLYRRPTMCGASSSCSAPPLLSSPTTGA